MKKILFFLSFFYISLLGEVINENPTPTFVNSNIPIVDIRTPSEWKNTGIIKNSKTITFFDRNGNYNIKQFLTKLNREVNTSKKFAVICRTGHRSRIVSNFLGNQLNYKVINLVGGIYKANENGVKLYKQK